VLLDTNSLFLPFRSGLRLEEEIRRWVVPGAILIPSFVYAELANLEARATPDAVAANALARRFPAIPCPGRGDAALVRLARELSATVVTSDRKLRERLNRVGITVLAPRDRAQLYAFPGRPVRPARRTRPPSLPRKRLSGRPG
jgi:rRNA-processing protein FCF1